MQVRRAADPRQLAAAVSSADDGDRVGRLAAAVQVEDRVEDDLVRGPVEVGRRAAPRRRRRSRPCSAACRRARDCSAATSCGGCRSNVPARPSPDGGDRGTPLVSGPRRSAEPCAASPASSAADRTLFAIGCGRPATLTSAAQRRYGSVRSARPTPVCTARAQPVDKPVDAACGQDCGETGDNRPISQSLLHKRCGLALWTNIRELTRRGDRGHRRVAGRVSHPHGVADRRHSALVTASCAHAQPGTPVTE